tara:strand:+ start:14413 stop:15060 length:648 start_codon:yes stop_codon:yes gene_type:complete
MFPALLAVMGCLGVTSAPIGDPEKSTVDTKLSGVWIGKNVPGFLIFEPYDRRTWLATIIGLEPNQENKERLEALEEQEFLDVMVKELKAGNLKGEVAYVHKAWLTTIEDVQFMTWEAKLLVDEDYGQTPTSWMIMRVRRESQDDLSLDFPNTELDDLGTVDSPYEAEGILRRNIKNPELFSEEEALTWSFERWPRGDYSFVSSILSSLGIKGFLN